MIPNIESKISFDWDLLLWDSSVIISKVHPVFSSGKKSLFIDNLKVGNLCSKPSNYQIYVLNFP